MTGDDNTINSILVVGGGTAGWMAAAYLRRRTGCDVTLVESPTIDAVGVGEATIPNLVDFFHAMGIDEDEFLTRCHATYKLGIKFVDWVHQGHAYWHPFGLCGGNIDGIDLFHFWLKRRRMGLSADEYSDYSLQTLLCNLEKAHRPIDGAPFVHNYAFHLDSVAFSSYLKEIAVRLGVTHLVANVDHVELDSNDHINQLRTTDGRYLAADLYLDCTGFAGVLIEQAMKDPFIDWSDSLLCDRAVVMRRIRKHAEDGTWHPYTVSKGLSAGWSWQIPLSNRVGMGYVYSSSHISDEDAANELACDAGEHSDSDLDARFLKMRVGRRTQFWKNNCVSLGLASGFIEPLESTGIFLIQRALEVLVEWFPSKSYPLPLIEAYNRRMVGVYEEVRDFIVLHYILSQRSDTQFWVDSRNACVPSSLQKLIDLYLEAGFVNEVREDPVFRETNFYHVLVGSGRIPVQQRGRADFSNFPAVCKLLDEIREKNNSLAERLPTNIQLMSWIHSHASIVAQAAR